MPDRLFTAEDLRMLAEEAGVLPWTAEDHLREFQELSGLSGREMERLFGQALAEREEQEGTWPTPKSIDKERVERARIMDEPSATLVNRMAYLHASAPEREGSYCPPHETQGLTEEELKRIGAHPSQRVTLPAMDRTERGLRSTEASRGRGVQQSQRAGDVIEGTAPRRQD